MKCDCVLYDPDPDAEDDETCYCGHVLDEHEPAPGGHPGACTVEDTTREISDETYREIYAREQEDSIHWNGPPPPPAAFRRDS